MSAGSFAQIILSFIYAVRVSEWDFRNISTLEKTLRMPIVLKHVGQLFVRRLLVIWCLAALIFFFLTKSVLIAIVLGWVLLILFELIVLDGKFVEKVIRTHHLNRAKAKSFALKEYAEDKELIKAIQETVAMSAWSIINFGYLALPSWGWEYILKFIFPLVVKGQFDYRDLLIGFSNKTIEADNALWQAAQKAGHEREQLVNQFIENYGNRIENWDLRNPSLRERPELIHSLLNLYSGSPSPLESHKASINTRESAEQAVMQNLRIPKFLFSLLMRKVQKNVRLREDRRFYEFEFDFYIRTLLLKLAQKRGLENNALYSIDWEKLAYV